MDTKYHFYTKRDGEPAKWASSRTNKSGSMGQWIKDLSQRWHVVKHAEEKDSYILIPRA